MRLRSFVVPVVGMASLAAGLVPAAAQPAAAVPATAPAAVVAASTMSLPPNGGDANWEPVFADDFTDADLGQWRNAGTGDAEGCWSVNASNHILTLPPRVKDGESWRCKLVSNAAFGAGTGSGSGTYIFAASVKMHATTGHLSSFWLNNQNGDINEIDVIENQGVKTGDCESNEGRIVTNDSRFYGVNNAYYNRYGSERSGFKYCHPLTDARAVQDDGFHVVHAVWTPPNSLRFFMDGQETTSYSGTTKDNAISAMLSNVDQQNAAYPNPGNFDVDWVRVWKQKPPPCQENDYWRAQFGPSGWDYQPNSDPSQNNLKRYVFDRMFYYFTYADVQQWAQDKVRTQGGNLWDHVQWHWLHYGIPQGRIGSPSFHAGYYLLAYADLRDAFGAGNYQAAIDHYVVYGLNEGRRGSFTFDAGFYRSCYGDLAGKSNAELLDHFTKYGIEEGRQGSADFAPAWYLAAYPDVRANYGNNNYRGGMVHWYSGGANEGRQGHP